MGLSAEHQQNRRPSDSNTDYFTHKDNGKQSDPQAGHKMSDIQATHDRHAGHSVAMFRDKFWLSFALTIPVVFWSADGRRIRMSAAASSNIITGDNLQKMLRGNKGH